MPTAAYETDAGGASPPARVKVWDPFVRIFHWGLVVLFLVAFATGDEIEWLHINAGYAIVALLVLRIVWGFAGSEHARFRDFVKRPGDVVGFLKATASLKAPRYLGHNPAGGYMVLALIGVISALCATGLLMDSDAFWGSKALEEIHEVLAYAAIGLIVLHVAGVAIASIEHRENLVRSMVTGWKRSA